MVGFIARHLGGAGRELGNDLQLSAHYAHRAAQRLGHLGDIFSAPFLHASWQHIEGNSGPLFVFGFLAAYRGVRKFLMVTLITCQQSGMTVWFVQKPRSPSAPPAWCSATSATSSWRACSTGTRSTC